jgi:hypothetical protein
VWREICRQVAARRQVCQKRRLQRAGVRAAAQPTQTADLLRKQHNEKILYIIRLLVDQLDVISTLIGKTLAA